jgi:hypothetical protein
LKIFLKRKIKCDKTIVLIQKFLKFSFKKDLQFLKLNERIIQGNSLSLLLCNIYFNELDIYVEKLKSICYTEKTSQNIFDSNFKKYNYIRYADTFVMGVIGSKEYSIEIRRKVISFLTEKLFLVINSSDFTILKFSKGEFVFLGTLCKVCKLNKKDLRLESNLITRNIFDVMPSVRVKMYAPIKSLLENGIKKGMFTRLYSGNIIAISVDRIVNYNHSDALHFFNLRIYRILSYYCFVENFRSLFFIVNKLRHSCALTPLIKIQIISSLL